MYQKSVLDNGLRLVTSTMPHTRSVSIGIFVGAGSRYEGPMQAGLSHFVEHLCFKGTEERPTAREISETIEGVGGVLNGGTDREMTVYWAKVARHHFLLALGLLFDMLRHSRFDPQEVEKERQVIIGELNMSMDSPYQRVDTLIDELLWPDQALGRDVAGSKETVNSFGRQMALDYLARQYVSSNIVVSIAGDISHDEAVDSLSTVFADWPDGTPVPWYPAQDQQKAPRLRLEPRKTEQAHLCLGVRGLSSADSSRFILDLLNVVLGEGMSSRLFLELRERRGLVYDIHSYPTHFRDSGSVVIYAGADPKRIEATIEIILGELYRFREQEVPGPELTKAKEFTKGRMLLRMEDTYSVAGWIGAQELLQDRIYTVDEIVSIIEAITPAELQRVARDLFSSDKLSLAIVGPLRSEKRLYSLLKL